MPVLPSLSHFEVRIEDKITEALFTRAISEFHAEIIDCINNFRYRTVEHFFWLNTEMSWIGLWNSALRRAYGNGITALQEIVLYNENRKYVGRPDLLIAHVENNSVAHLLFEAKLSEWKGASKASKNSSLYDYTGITQQLIIYNSLLQKQMQIGNIRLVPIVFEWMRSKMAVQQALSYVQELNKDSTSSFKALISLNDSGILVHGTLIQQ